MRPERIIFADDESGFLGIWDSDFCGGIKKVRHFRHTYACYDKRRRGRRACTWTCTYTYPWSHRSRTCTHERAWGSGTSSWWIFPCAHASQLPVCPRTDRTLTASCPGKSRCRCYLSPDWRSRICRTQHHIRTDSFSWGWNFGCAGWCLWLCSSHVSDYTGKSIRFPASCRKWFCKMRPRYPPCSSSCDRGAFKRNPFLYRFHQGRTSDANRCRYPSPLCGRFWRNACYDFRTYRLRHGTKRLWNRQLCPDISRWCSGERLWW